MTPDSPSASEPEKAENPKGVPQFGKTLGELRTHYLGVSQAELSTQLPWKLNGKQIINFFENRGRGSFEKAWDILEYLYAKGFNLHHFFDPEREGPLRQADAEVQQYHKTLAERNNELAEAFTEYERGVSQELAKQLEKFREKTQQIYAPITLQEDEALPLDSPKRPRPA